MTETLDDFRAEMRSFIETNCPPEMRDGRRDADSICWGGRNFTFESDAQKAWMEACAAKGYTTPTWPSEYGGGGMNRAQEKIWLEELDAANARPPLLSFGIWMLGPALLHFGSHEQKQKYLPDIIHGRIRWCQGYSEPGSGSDLASLQTKCEDMGDHWLVNGQKIWTSYADEADAIFCLTRTDRDAKKHLGISFVLFDMESEGVTTRPIKLISGKSPFCETFFDNVKVPKTGHEVVGEVNRGWDVAKYLLTHEREMISGSPRGSASGRAFGAILQEAVGGPLDPYLRANAVEAEIDSLAIEMTIDRYKDMAKSGKGVGHASAMLKYAGTELNKKRHELMMMAGGSDSLEWDGKSGDLPSDWLRTKANSIEGGTSEVMLGIISKRVLGLPG